MAETEIVLYGTKLSGHAHRVELLLLMLSLPYRFVDAPADIRRGEEFRKLNPLGQIPVLQDAGLVSSQKVGRTRTCRVEPAALSVAELWITERRRAASAGLDRLGDFLDATKPQPESGQ